MVGVFSQATSDGRRPSLKLRQGSFGSGIHKRVMKHWDGLPRKAVESLSPEVFKGSVGVALVPWSSTKVLLGRR